VEHSEPEPGEHERQRAPAHGAEHAVRLCAAALCTFAMVCGYATFPTASGSGAERQASFGDGPVEFLDGDGDGIAGEQAAHPARDTRSGALDTAP
jgi:hypothetical protein